MVTADAELMEHQTACPHCGAQFSFQRFHAGFSDEGFMYCDRDNTVLTWSSFDAFYEGLVGPHHPWMLSHEQKTAVEAAVVACPCGGHFAFDNPPLCPSCGADISFLVPQPIYFLVTGRRLDADRDKVWSTT